MNTKIDTRINQEMVNTVLLPKNTCWTLKMCKHCDYEGFCNGVAPHNKRSWAYALIIQVICPSANAFSPITGSSLN